MCGRLMALCGLLEQGERGSWQLKLIDLGDANQILSGESFDCKAQDVIDVSLDHLINESREVQRLYYWANSSSSAILLDIKKLSEGISSDLPAESRSVLLNAFDISSWRALIDIISSNVGSLVRNNFSDSNTRTDSWIFTVQNLQMALLAPEMYGYKLDAAEAIGRIQACLRILIKNYGEISNHNLLAELDNYIKFCSRNIATVSQVDNFSIFTKVCSKTAQLLSIEKLIAYESRQKEYKIPGCFQSLSYKIFSPSFKHLNDENVVGVLLLSHVLGAYTVRECCIRYVSLFLANELRHAVFNAVDEFDADVVRKISFVPKPLHRYMLQLASTNVYDG